MTQSPNRPPGPTAIAHRGCRLVKPENTLVALRAAIGVADLIEFDVRQCADGELVVIHDETVDRTTDGQGRVAQLTLAQLRKLDVGGWFAPEFAGERIPTLTETLAALGTDAVALVERKSGPANAYVKTLQETGAADRVVVQSFDWVFLEELHRLAPTIRLGALGRGPLDDDALQAVTRTGASLIAWAHLDIGADVIDRARSRDLKVLAWTPHRPEDFDRLAKLGVAGIIADDPEAVTRRYTPIWHPLRPTDTGD